MPRTRSIANSLAEAKYLALQAQGLSYHKMTTPMGLSFSTLRREVIRRKLPPPTTRRHATVHADAPERASMHAGAPDRTAMHPRASNGASMHAHARFDDPADAQSIRWNLTLPRGLRRRLQEQAKALGIDETKRVQALLWRGLEAEEAAQ